MLWSVAVDELDVGQLVLELVAFAHGLVLVGGQGDGR